jgi:hypothetical protein
LLAGGSISALCEPASRFTNAIERSGKWKKVRYNGLAQFGATERSPSMYIRMRATLSNTFSVQVGINFSPLANQPVVLPSAIERSGIWKGKIATAWAQFGATERSPSMYIRTRVLPWSNTLCHKVAGWDQFQLFL